MNYKKTKIILSLVTLCFFSISTEVYAQNHSGEGETIIPVLNEVEVDNPGGDLPNCEYVEVRGDANSTVQGLLFLLAVEGDTGQGTNPGTVDYVFNLTGRTFGTNGLITITGPSNPQQEISKKGIKTNNGIQIGPCGSRDYETQGTDFVIDSNVSFGNGSISFLLVSTGESPIQPGLDIDPNDNGETNGLPDDATIIDAVGWTDGDAGDFVYGGVNITPGNTVGSPDAATRNHSDITPLKPAAWFADDLTNTGVSETLYDQTNLVGGFRIDFITPGRLNLAPSAASGSISGRVINSRGRGLKFVTVMITGNSLPEALYATTNMFGRYQFEDLPVGDTYVLQAFSKRYTFDQSSTVINLNDNITDADFIGNQNR